MKSPVDSFTYWHFAAILDSPEGVEKSHVFGSFVAIQNRKRSNQESFMSIFGTVWEGARLWIAGGEYAEKRVPELLAKLIARHQDENAIAGIVSDWLRKNLVDENHVAAVYGIARLLKGRGGRFMIAAAEALETLPAVANEVQRMPAIKNASSTEERGRLFGAAMSDKFNAMYGAAKARLQHLPIPHNTSGGHVADTVTSSTQSASGGWFSGVTSGIGDVASKITEVALAIGQFIVAGIGLCAAYLIVCVAIAWNYPSAMDGFAWLSFYVLTGVPVALTIIGLPFGKHGTVLQFASLAFLVCLSSSLIVIAFVLAAVNGIIVNNAAWGTVIMLIVVTIVWWVCWAIAQKAVATPGFFISFVPKFVKGFSINKTEAEELATYWRVANTLDKISVTVAGAICAGILVLTIIKLWQQPMPFLLALGLLALELLIGGAFIRMSIRLSGEHDYPPFLGMKELVKKWMHRLYTSSMATAAAILIVIALIIGVASFLGDSSARDWWTSFRHGSIEAVEHSVKMLDDGARNAGQSTSSGTDRVTEYTESEIDREEDIAPAKSEPAKKKKAKVGSKQSDCAAFGGAGYCAAMAQQGMGDIYPCPCE